MGTLYLVATPIGNLEDLSPRAVRILREARLIAAEDTRRTRALLTHFGIHAPLTSYFEHNKLAKLDKILAELALGDVALVSDAGTPGINDPGYELVRAALDAGHAVSPVPGPSAPIAALAASGLPTDSFLYLGYLPRKKGERRETIAQMSNLRHTLVFFETPHRLLESLEDLESVLGDRQMCAAREISKVHEEFIRGRISQVRAHFTEAEPRGEFVLVVSGQSSAEVPVWERETLLAAIQKEKKAGKKARQIAAALTAPSGWPKRKIYALTLEEAE
ncbi:MAG: 16S rRNA (cytidine(1402)-2'-O)-methyltransferase [Anaerolineales bacterium]